MLSSFTGNVENDGVMSGWLFITMNVAGGGAVRWGMGGFMFTSVGEEKPALSPITDWREEVEASLRSDDIDTVRRARSGEEGAEHSTTDPFDDVSAGVMMTPESFDKTLALRCWGGRGGYVGRP